MVDRYDPMEDPDARRAIMVKDKDGDWVLHSDHTALCEAVREYEKTRTEYDLRKHMMTPARRMTHPVHDAYKHMLALANQ